MTRKKTWSEEQEDFLRANYYKLGAEEVAEILNKTKSAVVTKAKKMKITINKSWTKKENSFLKKNYKKLSVSDISKHIGRSEGGIIERAKKLGLTKTVKPWTEKDIEYLKWRWGSVEIGVIGRKLKRSEKAVYKKANELNLGVQAFAVGEYLTPYDISTILGMDYRGVYRLMEKGLLKYKTLLVGTKNRYQITPEDLITFLMDNPSKWNSNTSDIHYIKSTAVISPKINAEMPEWLKKKIEQDSENSPVRRVYKSQKWTTKEIELLNQYLQEGKSIKRISIALNRTYGSIRSKVLKLTSK